MPPKSYTTALFQGGIEKIATKIKEESQELIDAARVETQTVELSDADDDSPHRLSLQRKKDHVTHEAADLLYHFFVLLAACGVTLADVEQELERRFGISGLAEKDSRNKN